MPGRDSSVRVEGLREFRRDLKKLEPLVAKELRKDIKAAAEKVAADARADAPRVTGEYARSIKVYVTAKGASVGSRLPQAGVLHWGGTIQPRGVPIHFKARPVVSEALERRTDELIDDLGGRGRARGPPRRLALTRPEPFCGSGTPAAWRHPGLVSPSKTCRLRTPAGTALPAG
jgi:hypothetical protein